MQSQLKTMTKFPNRKRHFSWEMEPDFKSGLKKTLQLQLPLPSERRVLRSIQTLLNIICDLLDIRIGFLDKVESFEEHIREHQLLSGWLLIFLENNYEEIEDTSLRGNLSEELLVKIGFKKGSDAIKTILKRSKLVPDHIDPIDAVKRFVLDEFKYHRRLSIVYSPSKGGLDSKLEWDSVKVLNVPGVNIYDDGGTIIEDESSRLLFSVHLSTLCTDELHTVLYHGTDLQSAQDICTDGIDVDCGFRRRDFSNGTGFYLTKSYVHARNWAFSQTQKPVVLWFIIPNEFLKQTKSLDLKDVESKQSQWQEIVTQNRAGEPTKEMYSFLEKYDFLEGPISVSVCKPERTTDDCQQQPREAKLQSHQLCIISDDFADEISKYLVTMITYDEL